MSTIVRNLLLKLILSLENIKNWETKGQVSMGVVEG
jgi:hypothetical protein